jgi:5-methylcytosine-specific restriction protein A
MNPDPEDFIAGCHCLGCHALQHDEEGRCDNPGTWYLEMHLVDNCDQVEDGTTKAVVCITCRNALIESAKRIIEWGWSDDRSQNCPQVWDALSQVVQHSQAGRENMRATGFTPATRQLVLERADGRCERCTSNRLADLHHRRPRGAGGSRDPLTNTAANAAALCRPCHSWAEGNRTKALMDGWLLRQGQSPVDIPVLYHNRHWVYLTADGGMKIGKRQ